jgi:thymidylate kinase
MIIVLEGLEGVGKTTIGTILAKKFGAKYVKTPPQEFNSARALIASDPSRYTRFYFYLSGLFVIQTALSPCRESLTDHVVVDRYIHSTIAYHDRGESFTPPAYESEKLMSADLTVHVTCNEAERLRRKQARGFHLFDRVESNEIQINEYLCSVSNFELRNNGNLKTTTNELAFRINEWLSKNVNALRK